VLAKPGSERQSYASAISLKRLSAVSLLSGFLSGCHFKACLKLKVTQTTPAHSHQLLVSFLDVAVIASAINT
jgi:hypothetical protein